MYPSKLIRVAFPFFLSLPVFFPAGKKTGKDKKKGKATLISLLGYKNTIKYANNLILRIKSKLKKYGSKSRNLSETLNYILNRNK